MKILYIDKTTNYMARFMERTLFEYCHHYLIEFDYNRCQSDNRRTDENLELVYEKITLDNVQKCEGIAFNVNRMRDYLVEQSDKVEGVLYYTADKKHVVGCIWVMYKGGNEFQYRVRNVEAFGFDFGVMSDYRGKGIIGIMIQNLLDYLYQSKGISKLYASVRTNNSSAIKAYEKSGMRIVADKKFYRIAGIRFPYPII